MKFEFFFDISSPWTYIAFHNALQISAEYSIAVEWRPILVGGIFNTINPSVYEFRKNPVPLKIAYRDKDIADCARSTGLRLVWEPKIFPVNSVKAMRGCLVAARTEQLADLANALFTLYWAEDCDISQDDVLALGCDRIGFDKTVFFNGINEPSIKQKLKDNTEELMSRGGFGTPTMFVDKDDMYFGNDRLFLVREAFERTTG